MAEEREASCIRNGWIYVDYPAALPGWYPVNDVSQSGGWTAFSCGRSTPYTILNHVKPWWRRTEPADRTRW